MLLAALRWPIETLFGRSTNTPAARRAFRPKSACAPVLHVRRLEDRASPGSAAESLGLSVLTAAQLVGGHEHWK